MTIAPPPGRGPAVRRRSTVRLLSEDQHWTLAPRTMPLKVGKIDRHPQARRAKCARPGWLRRGRRRQPCRLVLSLPAARKNPRRSPPADRTAHAGSSVQSPSMRDAADKESSLTRMATRLTCGRTNALTIHRASVGKSAIWSRCSYIEQAVCREQHGSGTLRALRRRLWYWPMCRCLRRGQARCWCVPRVVESAEPICT